jgi:hypothetical protein
LSNFSDAAGGNGAEDRNLVEQAPEMTSILLLKQWIDGIILCTSDTCCDVAEANAPSPILQI